MIRYLSICFVLTQLIAGCNSTVEPGYNFDALLDAYGEVWNTGDLDPLDTLVSTDFEFRYNSSGPAFGIEPLIGAIQATRQPFTDFELVLIDQRPAGNNACHITGEWISYSDIEWATGID
ncbi:MAG: ester cyclase [Bacteroidales bacterium]|nr:ester cyclase [Bacteroidales bacterium]